jgi:plastocyanin
VFNAASKLYFTVAALAIVVGFGVVIGTSDRVGFSNLVVAGLAALGLGLAAYAFVPREPVVAYADEPAEARPVDTTDTAGASSWPVLGALALGLIAAGIAVEGWLLVVGVAVGLITAFGWLGQVWQEHPSWTQDMVDRVNDRFVVPFGLPGTIFVFVGLGVISLSRLFLAVPADVAPIIGSVLAFAILGTFFLLSTRQVARPAVASLAVLGVALILAAGVAGALLGEREFHHAEGEGELVIGAENLEFDTDEINLPASTEVTVVFENHEAVPHNWSLYTEQGGTAIYEGEILNTEGEIEYTFTTPEAGTYFFQCDVHPPQMTGTANVSEEASEEVEEGDNVTTTSSSTPGDRGPDQDDGGTGSSGGS